jgi:hypothetical protein
MYIEMTFDEMAFDGIKFQRLVAKMGGEIRIVSNDRSTVLDGFSFCNTRDESWERQRFEFLHKQALERGFRRSYKKFRDAHASSPISPGLWRRLQAQPRIVARDEPKPVPSLNETWTEEDFASEHCFAG